MRVLPGSLFGRLFVAIVAVVATTLLIILALIVRERRDFAALESGAGSSLTSIADTVEQLAMLAPPDREQALAELREKRRTSMQMRRARFDEQRVDRAELEHTVVAQLQRKLGNDYQVRAVRPGAPRRDAVSLSEERGQDFGPPGGGPPPEPRDGPPPGGPGGPPMDRRPFEIEVVLPDGDAIAFRMPLPRPGPPLPRQIFFEFGLLTLVLGAVLYVMTRTITRPLGKLATAADAIGRGARIEPLPEEGGRELQAATRAFNSMQERLRRYLDSRTSVLAAMSHDLRTPLTRLRLRVETIEDETIRARCAADLDEMNSMIRGALGLFRGLNDDEAAVDVDIDALLEGLRDETIETGGIVTLTGQANGSYKGRPLALKRALGNLVNNAVQYGKEANVSIDDGAALTIRIRDRGPGIPTAQLEQVFEPFFRLESSRSRDTGGTGLGLSIARDIVQAHGGALTLENIEGGLEATVTLPR